MKIFVTGGAGFIGRNLVEFLLQKGEDVTIFDNFSNSTEEKIFHLIKNGAKLVRGDITDYDSLLKALSGFDHVIHLAAKNSVQDSILHPEEITKVNVNGAVNLLLACVANKIRNVIATSSAAVYGSCDDLPLSENLYPNPISPYGASKLAVEYYLKAFANCYDMNCITLRPFNVYGLGQTGDYAGVITKFAQNIADDKPLVIFGDGSNTRDFVAIEDVIGSIHNAISKTDGKKGSVYNIASGEFVSIKNLAKLMISISGKNIDIIHNEAKKGDIKHSQATIFLAKKELGYVPKIKLKEGLQKLLKNPFV